MGIVYYNIYRTKSECHVDMEQLRNLDFFQSGDIGERFGVDINSIVTTNNFYKFDLYWDVKKEYTIAEDRYFKKIEIDAVDSKNIIILGRYILVQGKEDKKVTDFVMQHFSDEKSVPLALKFDEKVLDYIMKRGNRLKEVVYKQKRKKRADKVKLFSISSDLRSTEDFDIYKDKKKNEVRVVYGKKENMWFAVKEGNPGLIGMSTALRDRNEGLRILYGFIENLIEPNIEKMYQMKL